MSNYDAAFGRTMSGPSARLLRHVEAELVDVGWPDAEGPQPADGLAAVEGGVVHRVDDDLIGRDAEVFSVGLEAGDFG